MKQSKIEARVDRGFDRLTRYYGPGWVNNVDLSVLDLDYEDLCVLGQVERSRSGHTFMEGMAFMGLDIRPPKNYLMYALLVLPHLIIGVVTSTRHGFAAWSDCSQSATEREWKRRIRDERRRQSEDQAWAETRTWWLRSVMTHPSGVHV